MFSPRSFVNFFPHGFLFLFLCMPLEFAYQCESRIAHRSVWKFAKFARTRYKLRVYDENDGADEIKTYYGHYNGFQNIYCMQILINFFVLKPPPVVIVIFHPMVYVTSRRPLLCLVRNNSYVGFFTCENYQLRNFIVRDDL